MKAVGGFLKTHPLWTQVQFGLKQFEIPDFSKVQSSIHPPPENIRLGHQVEHIFLQLLQRHPDFKILGHNLQVKKGNTTIGELDFIVSSKAVIKHIEISYKFYIIDPDISEPIHRLMGPNRSDMFFTKLEKTRYRQLPLLQDILCSPILSKMGLQADMIEQEVLFLGQLFEPLDQHHVSIRPLNNKCISGFWCRISDFEGDRFRESEYYIPSKKEWIHAPHKEVYWTSHYETLLDINLRHINRQSPMLWRKFPDGSFEKFFVVWW